MLIATTIRRILVIEKRWSNHLVAEEHVLVIPATRLEQLGSFSGFIPFSQERFDALLDPAHMSFLPRSAAEDDPSFKQLIPYAILKTTVDGEPSVFQYTRGKGQGEKRLHAKRSIGIGGHISKEDAQGDDLYRCGMQRELEEEMIIEARYTESLLGFIYDDSSEVGRVHLGVVHVLELPSPAARARESELIESGFAKLSELVSRRAEFETWSQLCLDQLIAAG